MPSLQLDRKDMYLALIQMIVSHPIETQEWMVDLFLGDIIRALPFEHRYTSARRLDIAADTLTMIVDELRKQADAAEQE